MNVTAIKQKMQLGDLITVAKMLGITRANAAAALCRPGSKYHNKVVQALNSITTTREVLIANYTNKL